MIDVVEVGAGGGSIAWIDDDRRAQGRPAQRGRRPRPDLLSRRRHRADHHRRQCRAGTARPRQLPRRPDEARRRRRGAAASRRRSPSRWSIDTAARRRPSSRSRSPKMSLRGARSLGREGLRPARLRAGGVGRRRAAAYACAIARELHIPTRDRAAVPVALLRARHAAGRRAARLHPHLLRISPSIDFGKLVDQVHDEMVQGGDGRCAAPPRAQRCRSISTCAMSARSSPCRCRSRSEQLKAGDRKAHPHRVRRAVRASLRASLAGRAGRDGQHPPGGDRQAPRLKFPSRAAGRPAKPRARAQGLLAGARDALTWSIVPARRWARARPSRVRQSSRSTAPTTVLSHGDTCHVSSSRASSLIDVGRCSMNKALDPVTLEVIRNALPAVANEMAADLQRTSYNMMIYEVRDYCTALIDTRRRADLAERRRRVALRRRPGRRSSSTA